MFVAVIGIETDSTLMVAVSAVRETYITASTCYHKAVVFKDDYDTRIVECYVIVDFTIGVTESLDIVPFCSFGIIQFLLLSVFPQD